MSPDYSTHTEADAGTYERHHAAPDDDRPTLSEVLAAEEAWAASLGLELEPEEEEPE